MKCVGENTIHLPIFINYRLSNEEAISHIRRLLAFIGQKQQYIRRVAQYIRQTSYFIRRHHTFIRQTKNPYSTTSKKRG